MKTSKTARLILAIAAMMIMPMAANAQFGGLGKKLKSAAKEAVIDKKGNVQGSVIDAKNNPQGSLENAKIAKAGGLQKYLGLDDEAGQTVWSYYQRYQKFASGNGDKDYKGGTAELGNFTTTLIDDYKILKSGDKESIADNKSLGNYPGRFNRWIKTAKDVTTWKFHPVSSQDSQHFIEVIERMRKLYNERVKEYDL